MHRFDVGEGTILVLEFLNDASGKSVWVDKYTLIIKIPFLGRRVTAFDCIAGFAGSAVAIDV